jgi:AcrR family transcriptional regulator
MRVQSKGINQTEQNGTNNRVKPRERTKAKILFAATNLFGEQGFDNTTISQIARKAGVTPGCVYKHFQRKEDIYYVTFSHQLKTRMPALEETLFGINGALNKLRKYLWDYVRNMTENVKFAKMVFLQMKTSQHFTQTEAYKDVQGFYRKMIDIIEEGQKSGELDPDINPYFARVLVLGGLEHIMIRWLLKGCSFDVYEHLDGFLKIVEKGLRAKACSKLANDNGK